MITPEQIQQIKTAYSWLKPSPIFDLVEAYELLQKNFESAEQEQVNLLAQLKKNHSICGVCFTSSWQPCPSETPNAFPDQKTGGWMVCGYCSLAAALEELQAENQELLKAAQDAYGVMEYLFCHYYPQDSELEEAMNELGAAIDKVTKQEKQ